MRKYFIGLVLLLSGAFLSAQEVNRDWCGLHKQEGAMEALRVRRDANKAVAEHGIVTPRDIQYVPVSFHLVAKSDGSDRISEHLVLDQLCELNEDFLPYNIQFFLKNGELNYLNNTTVFENHLATVNTVMTSNRVNRSLNVWIVDCIDPVECEPDYEGPVSLAYYSPFKDWIVCNKGDIKGTGIALTHEFGHFFSLDHPFLGWENNTFGDDANEVGVNAPPTSPGGLPTERVNGSNCNVAGDGICDTPPDYNNGLGSSTCTFTGNVLDPNGEQINPDEGNYVSYFLLCEDEDYHFTEQQNAVIQADLNSLGRNFLFQDPVPNFATITESPDLVYPINSEAADSYNAINFQWNSVPHATAYYLEISRVSTFTLNPVRLIVYGNSVVLGDFTPDKRYYWRVRPINAYSTCASMASSIGTFFSGGVTATMEPAFVADWKVAPNPVNRQQDLSLEVISNEPFQAEVALYDINGRLVSAIRQIDFATGENRVSVPTTDLASGLYIIRVLTDVGQLTEKVIIGN